jgi:hypothetical protein
MTKFDSSYSYNALKNYIASWHLLCVFQYQKPLEVYGLEKKVLQELKKIKPCKEGDVQCNPS